MYLRQIKPETWYKTLQRLCVRSQIPNAFIFDELHDAKACQKLARTRPWWRINNRCVVCYNMLSNDSTVMHELIHRPDVWSLLKENTYISNCMISGNEKYYFYIDIVQQRCYKTKVGPGFQPDFGSKRTTWMNVCLTRIFASCSTREIMPTLRRLSQTKMVLSYKTPRNLIQLGLPSRLLQELLELRLLMRRYTLLFTQFRYDKQIPLPLLYADLNCSRPPLIENTSAQRRRLRRWEPYNCEGWKENNDPSTPAARWIYDRVELEDTIAEDGGSSTRPRHRQRRHTLGTVVCGPQLQ